MDSPIIFALHRAVVTLMAMFGLVGVAAGLFFFGPVVELRLAPVVQQWEIVDLHRVGDKLEWRIIVDKRRSCPPQTVWIALWDNETAIMRVEGPSGAAFQNTISIMAGERVRLGPFTAPVPRGWDGADGIRIRAVVTYDCGLPWRMPPLVSEAVVSS